jgi:hypothetical protein
MAGQQAVWHVVINDNQEGPLTKAQVLEYLSGGLLTGSDPIWRPGFAEWKSVGEIAEFWQPARPPAGGASPATERTEEQAKTTQPKLSTKFSLWKSANIGLGLSALSLLPRLVTDSGDEIADYAHTASVSTIAYLIGEITWLPLLFVLIAGIINVVYWRHPKSNASALWGAMTFVSLLAVIIGGLMVYGEIFFSSNQTISGAFRKKYVAEANSSCIRNQRSQLAQDVAEANIEKIQKFCACVTERSANSTTYKQAGAKLDANGLADLKQRVEAASSACADAIRSAAQAPPTQSLSQSEFDAVIARLKSVWKVSENPSSPDEPFVVIVQIRLNRDRRLAAQPLVVSTGNSPRYREAAEAAVRAIELGQPYSMLRDETYDAWKDMEITFDPRQMAREKRNTN